MLLDYAIQYKRVSGKNFSESTSVASNSIDI